MRSRGTTTPRGFGARGRAAVGAVGLAVGLVGAAGLMGLAGCSGESRPTPSMTWTPLPQYPSPTPTPAPTPSPTPTDPAAVAPERPDAMDEVSVDGAEAFATYYMELFPYVYATGDVEAFRTHSHSDCIFCADVIRKAEEQLAGGGHTVGGLVDVQDVTALEVDPGKWWAVSMEAVEGSLQDIDRDGNVVAQTPEMSYHLDMAVVLVNGTWQMREVTPVAAP